MEIFLYSSNYISKLITEFQNNKIDKITLNKNLLINSIFSYNCLKNKNKNYKKLKEEQSEIFQSFFIREQKQEKNEKELLSRIKDRKSKKIVIEAIKEQREILIKDLSSKKNIKLMQEHTYDTFIPPKNISLSLNLELIEKKSKYDINVLNTEIMYMNPNLNDKKKTIINNFIEPTYYNDFDFDNINMEDEINDSKNNNINNENNKFIKILNEEDEILFYDEKLSKNENLSSINNWSNKLKKDDIMNDFEELKQKEQGYKYNNVFLVLKETNVIEKERNIYYKSDNTILYKQISQKDHYHEFIGYLSEKSYKSYMKKMNYSYLILMLLSYFDFEKFNNDYEFLEESETFIIFIKKIFLFCGISINKVYDSLVHTASNIKGDINFDNYLNFFSSIFNLSNKYQMYKYSFLLFLVKKSNYNTISMNNYKLFYDLIKGKLIYEPETCNDIIGKMLPLIRTKYPKEDLNNLNFQHVSLILEFLIDYE